jgi:AcrR family transcriptional regulator
VEKGAGHRLLGAATALFAEKGYSGTYVNDIVTNAGVTKPVLYYYFKSKSVFFSLFWIQPSSWKKRFWLERLNRKEQRLIGLHISMGAFIKAPWSTQTLPG